MRGSMKIKKFRFLNNQGQGVMEYLIITSLIGIVSLVAVKAFGKTVRDRLSDVKERLNKEIDIRN